MTTTRRAFLRNSAAGVAAAATPALFTPALAQAKARVVVIGGGPGGATCARYLAKDAGDKIAVTLVEASPKFTTCFHSNLYVGGFKKLDDITFGYDKLKAQGVTVATAMATKIDRSAKSVSLGSGGTLPYDRLVVAPGIDIKFDSVPGYSEKAAEVMPHAWKAGPQTELLRKRLDALKDGDLVVMVAPPNPYRCPPGPYERISMMAHLLKTTGRGKCRIVVLDPKPAFSKQALFMDGWEKHFPGMVEWQDPKTHGGIKSVDPSTNSVVTDLETYKAALVNVIPAQMAGRIAAEAGLTNATGWCPIKPESMKSALDDNVFVLGDASIAGDMPKSGFSANSQAKVAAMVIRSELAGGRLFPARYANTCWSLITTDDTVKVGGAYEPKDGKIAATTTFISQKGETAELRKQTSEENIGWYAGITADIFG
jgi:NADPH-dependent 2,4-dienoyl-CoA reductase/sulfur reductase-like enzyme